MQSLFRFPEADPPLPPQQTLPTMYDLPSEDPEESGKPDEFHDLQPQLLNRTLRLVDYPAERIFTGSDLNLYYDGRHPQWYKRPDWFLVLDVPRLYEGVALRSSYVVWQECVDPFVVVELLSPGTEKEDLGENATVETKEAVALPPLTASSNGDPTAAERENGQSLKELPPRKWDVYERILRVPYYVVFSRHSNTLRFFQLVGGHYQEQSLEPTNPRIWIPELKRGLGVWQGSFEGVMGAWLRWYDENGDWMPTDTEQERQEKELAQELAEQERQRAEQERQRAEQERQRAEQERQEKELALEKAAQVETQLRQVALNLLQTGMSINQVAQLTGLSEQQVRDLASN